MRIFISPIYVMNVDPIPSEKCFISKQNIAQKLDLDYIDEEVINKSDSLLQIYKKYIK